MKHTLYVETATECKSLNGLPYGYNCQQRLMEYADESVGILHNLIELEYTSDNDDVPQDIQFALRVNRDVICWDTEEWWD